MNFLIRYLISTFVLVIAMSALVGVMQLISMLQAPAATVFAILFACGLGAIPFALDYELWEK